MPQSECFDQDQALYNEILGQLRERRKVFEQAESEYFLALRDVELEHGALLTDFHGSFVSFLRDTGLCDPGRYTTFRSGLAFVTDEDALEVGSNVVTELARTTDPSKVALVVEYAKDNIEARGGIRPSKGLAKQFMVQAQARTVVPKATKEKTRVSELVAEIQKLRADLRLARHRIKELEKELAARE